jgi:hypothetical protein
MTRAAWWGYLARWLAAIALGAAAFEALDAFAGQNPMVSWITLLSPVLSGGIAAWVSGGGVRSRLLASAAVAWARIGADRAIGLAHGVRQPLEVEAAVAAFFGIPWMVLAAVGGLLVVLTRLRPRPQSPRRRYGSSPRVT